MHYRVFLLVALSLFCTDLVVEAQVYEWFTQIETRVGQTITLTDIGHDSDGNIYAIGIYSDTARFENEHLITKGKHNGADDFDIYIVKMDPTGRVAWARSIRSDSSIERDQASKILVDDVGNSYVSGMYSRYNDTTRRFVDLHFLVKYSPEGERLWTIEGETGWPSTVLALHGRNLYVGGTYRKMMELAEKQISSDAESSLYVAAIDTSGKVKWLTSAGGDNTNSRMTVSGMNATDDGVSVIGTLIWTTRFDSTVVVVEDDTARMFYAKYAVDGNSVDASIIGKGTAASHVAYTNNQLPLMIGNVRTGAFLGTDSLVLSESTVSSNGLYIARLNSSLQVEWIRPLSGGRRFTVNDFGVGAEGDFYVAGWAYDQVTLDPYHVLRSDIVSFLGHYDRWGNVIWSIPWNGSIESVLTVDSTSRCLLAQRFFTTSKPMIINEHHLWTNGHSDLLFSRIRTSP